MLQKPFSRFLIFPALLFLLCLTACGKSGASDVPVDAPPSFRFNDVTYCTTGRSADVSPAEDEQSGRITSLTERSLAWPLENGQANFECLGAPYVDCGDGLALLLHNGEWGLYEARDVSTPS